MNIQNIKGPNSDPGGTPDYVSISLEFHIFLLSNFPNSIMFTGILYIHILFIIVDLFLNQLNDKREIHNVVLLVNHFIEVIV